MVPDRVDEILSFRQCAREQYLAVQDHNNLAPSLFSSIGRCASTISSSLNVLPTVGPPGFDLVDHFLYRRIHEV